MTVVPKQVIAIASKGRGSPIALPFNTSLLIYAPSKPLPEDRVVVNRLQVLSLPYTLCKVSPTFFQRQPREAEIALRSISSSDLLLKTIVDNHFIRAAGRLVGADRFLGDEKMVDELLKGLSTINIRIQECNPFACEKPLLHSTTKQSAHAARITAMWQQYRPDIIDIFPKPPGLPTDAKSYLNQVNEQYAQDAYHSLSIEGYQVSRELIEKIKRAQWHPESNSEDKSQRDALAVRGYYEAFLAVKETLSKILAGSKPGDAVEKELSEWYRKLLAPCVAAGIINPSDLFGYRRSQVYIRNSRHTPLPAHALGEAMGALFHCLKQEEHAGVRAVLGHFIFVFIHPYMDGNGRVERFLMNAMLGSGGYPWTIVHLKNREQYLDALEEASVGENITPFTEFLLSELKHAPFSK